MSVHIGGPYLAESIESILRQSLGDFVFLIIDDGSVHEDLKLLQDMQAKDDRIIIIRQNNLGLTKSLNRGIQLTRSRYIARQDADDFSHPDRLKMQYEFITNFPECAVLGTWYESINRFGEVCQVMRPPSSFESIKRTFQKGNPLCHGSVMFDADRLDYELYYNDQFIYSQDLELWTRLAKRHQIHNLKHVLYRRRCHDNSISENKSFVQSLFAAVVIYREIFNRNPSHLNIDRIGEMTIHDQIIDKDFIRVLSLVLWRNKKKYHSLQVLPVLDPLRFFLKMTTLPIVKHVFAVVRSSKERFK
ncbi:MAG: glycosyltransferase [Proteobacteria bacterium]|nr:glycosyltransferase [Pseudomonadota bacterium]